jgi:glycerate dehydrogenase
MNTDAFSKMKNTAVFINTARGGLVDETALGNALLNKNIYAAAIDVLTDEPMKKECCLLGIPNLIITPHVAWASIETRCRLLQIIDENIECFLNGTPKNNVAE